MTDRPRHLSRWIITLVVLATVGVPLVAVGHSLYIREQEDWAWSRAELDRDALNQMPISDSVTDGTVVKESSVHAVVKYTVEMTGWWDAPTGEFKSVCFHFPYQDPDTFRKVPCP